MNINSKKIVDSTIVRLAARQFWLDGELSSPCSSVFFEDADQVCWKLWYDDENYVWRLNESNEAFPIVGEEKGGDGFIWRDIEPAGAGALLNIRVMGFETIEDRDYARAFLRFENGYSLEVAHYFRTDKSDLKIKSET